MTHAEAYNAIVKALPFLSPLLADSDGVLRFEAELRFLRDPETGKFCRGALESYDCKLTPPEPLPSMPTIPMVKTPLTDWAKWEQDFGGLSVRTRNVLRCAHIPNIEELAKWRRKDIFKLRQCGEKTVRELDAFLQSRQLQFK